MKWTPERTARDENGGVPQVNGISFTRRCDPIMQTLRTRLRLSCGWVGLVSTLVFLFSAGWSAVGYAQITAYPVTVFKSGGGLGTVTSVGLFPTEIDCGLTCSGFGPEEGSVTLTAVPGRRLDFHWLGWTRLQRDRDLQLHVGSSQHRRRDVRQRNGRILVWGPRRDVALLDPHGLRRREQQQPRLDGHDADVGRDRRLRGRAIRSQ